MSADLAQKINEITDRVLNDRWQCDEDVVRSIKSAIYAGIEEAQDDLWERYVMAVAEAAGIDRMVNFLGSVESHEKIFRAMRAAQWAEIEKERK